MKPYLVVAEWDNEARVWVATSDDIPGLVAEAEDKERLVRCLQERVPELLALNAHLLPPASVPRDMTIHWVEDQNVRLSA
ncbi:MAG: DUF1902 domain-containing protein [Reyranella sp.]|jgi:predicted RNase H-like HicB family nuclease|nr:DUF1902 domain-containing protein [Reyranella sp.]